MLTEKHNEVLTIEQSSTRSPDSVDSEPLPVAGSAEREEAERRLVRKLDRRLLPTIVIVFIMNYIDRNAVTTARLKGLEADLGLTGEIHSNLKVTHNFGGIVACRFFIGLPEAAFYPGGDHLLAISMVYKEGPATAKVLAPMRNSFDLAGAGISIFDLLRRIIDLKCVWHGMLGCFPPEV
ncbi:hypothetical protein PQX77_020430 [Marasmius sp. AFHP31]|nr:hypothetical protein PQX77_020430 [Marasmius sp. AFHP31]